MGLRFLFGLPSYCRTDGANLWALLWRGLKRAFRALSVGAGLLLSEGFDGKRFTLCLLHIF